MKIKKNVNMNSIIVRLEELSAQSLGLANDFKKAIALLDDTKLGIGELNYNIDEDLMRFERTYTKVYDLIKSL